MSLAIFTASAEDRWQPVGLGGSGGMFSLAISPRDPELMMINCDMSAAYVSRDAGRAWKKLAQKGREHFGAFYHPDHPKWIYMTPPFRNIQRVTLDPARPEEIILTTFGSSILRGPATP